MKTLWDRITNEEEVPNEEMERRTSILGELIFSPKREFDEIDLESISLLELETLYKEILDIDTDEDNWFFTCQDIFLPTLLEAQMRNVMAEKMWFNSKNQGKKRFF